MKFITDSGISLQNGISIKNCKIREYVSQQLQKTSTCDYEFDCCVSDFQAEEQNEDIIEQEGVLKNRVTQLKTKTSPDMVGQLSELQRQRKKLVHQYQSTQFVDEENVNEAQTAEETEEVEEADVHVEDEQKELDDQLDLDVKAFDQDLDGGPGDGEQSQEKEDSDEGSQQFEVQQEMKTDFNVLHYSNPEDIPPIPFVWAGKTYNFGSKHEECEIHCENEVISIQSDDVEVESREQERFTYSLKNEYIQELNKQLLWNEAEQQHVQPKCSPPKSQFQSQFQEFQNIYNSLQSQQLQIESDMLSLLHIEIGELNDVVVVSVYDSNMQQRVMNGKQDVVPFASFHILAFIEVFCDEKQQIELKEQVKETLGEFHNKQFDLIFDTEKRILTKHLPQIIQEQDPDIVLSWKNSHNGLGRVVIRATAFDFDFLGSISRTPKKKSDQYQKLKRAYKDQEKIKEFMIAQGMEQIGLQVPGRLIFATQFLFKMNYKMGNYTYYHCLQKLGIKQKIFQLDDKIINTIMNKADTFQNQDTFQKDGFYLLDFSINNSGVSTSVPLYHSTKNAIQHHIYQMWIIQKINFLIHAQETSKLFKIPFYEAITRGSQYKVEAFMFTESRKQNFVLGPSPTRYEVSAMRAMESIPLVAEPVSGFYEYPLLVFDFASLYPSIICAYNLCYCTILENFKKQQKIGPFQIQFRANQFQSLSADKDVIYSPVHCLFVKSRIREGILPKLMKQCLAIRKQIVMNENKSVMQKEQIMSMYEQLKNYKFSQAEIKQIDNVISQLNTYIQKCHARQMALKGLMNTTYGYTSASFTGRMPCSLIADSIMEISRQTLDFCIKLVETEYNCDVLYADTDSMFVYTKKIFEQPLSQMEMLIKANQLGQKILQHINSTVPPPVRIKLERIYMPCFLVTKKRYVGQSFNPDTIEKLINKEFNQIPRFVDAKGIESIRREVPEMTRQCMSQALQTLFQVNDLSQLKQFFQEYFYRYIFGDVQLEQFIFQRKCKLQYSSSDRSLTANIAAKQVGQNSYQLIPEYGERVSYVIIKSQQNKLVNNLQTPQNIFDVDEGGSYQTHIHYSYYLERQLINPLQRLFGLCGFSVQNCIKEVGKFVLRNQQFLFQFGQLQQEKFRMLLGYFCKLNFDNIEYNQMQQLKSFQKVSYKNYTVPSQNYGQQFVTISKKVFNCVCCGGQSNFCVDKVAICQGCTSVLAYRNEQIRYQKLVALDTNQIQQGQLIQVCQNCFGVDSEGFSYCANWLCPIYRELVQRRIEEATLRKNLVVLE